LITVLKRQSIGWGAIETIDLKEFTKFLDKSKPYDFDVMLEIKDKEKSALGAVEVAS
jgi:UV DNA damage endonuclease